jgi:hypothetical protein
MDYVSQTITSTDTSINIEVPPKLRNRKVQVIILPVEDTIQEQQKPRKRNLGFMPGSPIPDSFFDPLPEEDLQAWEGNSSWGI